MSPYSIGIDVGTTYTAAAICRDGRADIAPLGDRGWSVPSVVYLGPDRLVLVGDAALRRANSEPLRVVREFKRRIGDSVPLVIAGAPMSADSLTGWVIRSVVDQITALEGGPPSHAVITHPANWGPFKVECLRQAIQMSGLAQQCTTSLMSEPEAAAAYYANAQKLEAGEIVAVYDFGGGTFDAAILRRTDAGWDFLAADGVERLGGIDFDQALISHVDAVADGRVQELDPADSAAMSALIQLKRDCIEAKEALSSDVEVTIAVALPNYRADVRLTRHEFESMIEPSIQIGVEALQRVLIAANVDAGSLRAVLLVGGSSRIPLVSQIVSKSLHVPVSVDAHPKHSIALGAALTAYHRSDDRGGSRRSTAATNPMNPAELPPPPLVASSVPPGAGHPVLGAPGPPGPLPPDGGGRGGPGNGPPTPRTPQPHGRPDAGSHQQLPNLPAAPLSGDPMTGHRRLWAIVAAAVVGVVLISVGVFVVLNRSDGGGAVTGNGSSGSATPSGTPESASTGSADPTSSGSGTASPAVVAPTGTGGGGQVLFETERDGIYRSIWQVTLDGGPERPVIVGTAPPVADGHPTFSKSGMLAYLHRATDNNDDWELIVSGPDGTGARAITDGVGQNSRPAWSPDETKIVIPLAGEGGKTDLWILDLTTGERRQLTTTAEQEVDPDWSADGTQIAFRRDVPPLGDAEIFVIDLASGTERRLTNHPGYDSDPHFSPDGSTMLMTREFENGNIDVATMSATEGDAGPVVNLSNHPGRDQDPVWTPSGLNIVWQSDRIAGDTEIFWMRSDGANPERLTFHPGFDGVPDVRGL